MPAEREAPGWRRIRTGGDDVVLAVDFGPRQGEAGFVRLARLLPGTPSVYVTVPPSAARLGRVDVTTAQYVRTWVTSLRSWRPRVVGVLTFCAGAAFATAIRDAVEPDDVPVVLLDPVPVTRQGIREEFRDAVAPWREVHADHTAAADWTSGTEGELCRHAAAAYEEIVAAAATRSGLPDHLVRALPPRYADFMAYLAAAARADLPAANLIVCSADCPADDRWAGSGTRVVRVPESRAQLLASPQAARAIAATLRIAIP